MELATTGKMWMQYVEWSKPMNLKSTIQHLERLFSALALEAALRSNRLEEIEVPEDTYLGAQKKCQEYLNQCISIEDLVMYLNTVGLDSYGEEILNNK